MRLRSDFDNKFGINKREAGEFGLVEVHDKEFVGWGQPWWLLGEFRVEIGDVACTAL